MSLVGQKLPLLVENHCFTSKHFKIVICTHALYFSPLIFFLNPLKNEAFTFSTPQKLLVKVNNNHPVANFNDDFLLLSLTDLSAVYMPQLIPSPPHPTTRLFIDFLHFTSGCLFRVLLFTYPSLAYSKLPKPETLGNPELFC